MKKKQVIQKPNNILIHSFKHNGKFHRSWLENEIYYEDDDLIICTSKKASVVIESNKRRWKIKEDTISYFFKDKWFNVVVMNKPDGLHYYCNLASPSLKDHEGIKYIDYDLDIKLLPSGRILLLDRKEFNDNKVTYSYPNELIEIVLKNTEVLKQMIKNKSFPFDDERNHKIFNLDNRSK